METSNNSRATFFGQPRGLSTLFFTEMWERFSYYGMRAILLFYMYYAVKQGGLGISQSTAASIMSIYGALVYLSSVLGGWLADRVWGAQRTVMLGGILIAIGQIVLAIPAGVSALYLSITLIVIGTGLFKPNVSNMVGQLYSSDDPRRDAGFSIYVFGINLGAAVAPLVIPWVARLTGPNSGVSWNFHAGFGVSALGMVIGLIQYYYGARKSLSKDSFYPSDPIDSEGLRPILIWTGVMVLLMGIILALLASMQILNINSVIMLLTVVAILIPVAYFVMMLNSRKVTRQERSRVWAYIPLFVAAAIFWGIEESGSVVLALFAEQRTILHIGSWHLAAANFQALNPIFIMILTPFFVVLWDHWQHQPSAPGKFAAGLIIAGVSYMWMALPGMIHGTTNGRVSPFWLIGSWLIVEVAEMLISPIGLSVTTKLAPRAFQSQMMSLWFMADAAGQAVNSQIVKYYSSSTEVQYFLIIGGICAVCGIVMSFFVPRIKSLMVIEH